MGSVSSAKFGGYKEHALAAHEEREFEDGEHDDAVGQHRAGRLPLLRPIRTQCPDALFSPTKLPSVASRIAFGNIAGLSGYDGVAGLCAATTTAPPPYPLKERIAPMTETAETLR